MLSQNGAIQQAIRQTHRLVKIKTPLTNILINQSFRQMPSARPSVARRANQPLVRRRRRRLRPQTPRRTVSLLHLARALRIYDIHPRTFASWISAPFQGKLSNMKIFYSQKNKVAREKKQQQQQD